MTAGAIVVGMSAAEAAIGRWRRLHTVDGADGMPAHVTLLYPFVDGAELPARVDDVRAALAGASPFDAALVRTARFGGSPAVLYLAPEPSTSFAAMTSALARAFPEHPPYGGIHAEVIPHVTVAESADGAALDRIERGVTPLLPIRFRVEEVLLMAHVPGAGWGAIDRIRLAG